MEDLGENKKKFDAGEIVFSEGDKSTELYVLLSGEMELDIKGNNIGTIDTPGSYFGEMSILLNQQRYATLKAIKESIVLEVPAEKLIDLIKGKPDLAITMMKNLASRVAEQDEKLYENE